MNGTPMSNYRARTRFAIDSIYTNPEVTKEGQDNLALKLHNEIDHEKELTTMFRNRAALKQKRETSSDGAKAFNDFCIDFLETSKKTKESVSGTLEDAQKRYETLKEVYCHLEDVERETYRFEMNLPSQPMITKSMKDDILLNPKEK